jgi:hypothetical protein
MKSVLCFIALLAVSLPVHATLYECTAADGSVAFRDRPCQAQKQEILKEITYSHPKPSSTPAYGHNAVNRPYAAANPTSDDMEDFLPLSGSRRWKGVGNRPIAARWARHIWHS